MADVIQFKPRPSKPTPKTKFLDDDLRYVVSKHVHAGLSMQEVVDTISSLLGRCFNKMDPNWADEKLREKVFARIQAWCVAEEILQEFDK